MPVQIGGTASPGFTDPLGLLSDCHRRIESFLEIIERVASQGSELDEESATALSAALRYFREAAPKHVADEERSLFPRLRSIDSVEVHRAMAEVERLEADHARADGLHQEADDIGRAWIEERRISPERWARLRSLAAELRTLYGRHIRVEDELIFPMAQRLLTPEVRLSIGQEMAARRSGG